MINLKSKRVSRTKRSNNEKWFLCKECDFTFAIYDSLNKPPCCPKCGDHLATIKIDPPFLSARENYKPWEVWELPYVEKVMSGEILPYQCAMKLDRSIASIEGKVRRLKKRSGK